MDKPDKSELLRLLPSIDQLLQTRIAAELLPQTGAKNLTALARRANENLRVRILCERNGDADFSREDLLKATENELEKIHRDDQKSNLRRVINATGVIVHTNLGRAPLSENAVKAITENAAYCTLEYDVQTGKRGKRGAKVEKLLCELTGAEDALVVNNCAAATFLVLTVLAKNGEAIVSRGELVEIGGDFRVPDVMEQSGAILKEVGTTNRTKIADYERAINENTKMIVKVHPSNYRIIGFTQAADLSELADLAHKKGITLYEDAGSGAMLDLSKYGLTDEPVISDSIKAGVDVVTFSGDKLLGAAQSGLIVGKREVVERIRKHPLYRALRVDKLIYAALEATLETFRRETSLTEIPVLKMLSMTQTKIEDRIKKFAQKLKKRLGENANLRFEIVKGKSVVGGGSAPMIQPETFLIALRHEKMSAATFEENLRLSNPPIIARILEDKVLIDLRTVFESDEEDLLKILTNLSAI